MKAKDFEQLCLFRMQGEEKRGTATMGRYGVQASFLKGDDGQMQWRPLSSLPDFEGVLPPMGRQFLFDAKVCSQASLAVDDSKFKERQLRHLFKRAKFGAVSFVLIHWPERVLRTRTDPPITWAFPVDREHPFWAAVDREEVKSITRADCEEYAALVPWNTLPGGRKPTPDILCGVEVLMSLATA